MVYWITPCDLQIMVTRAHMLKTHLRENLKFYIRPLDISKYTNTVFIAILRAVPGSTTPISCPYYITTLHVSASQGPSSGVYVVAR
jgi:hypothetical protein